MSGSDRIALVVAISVGISVIILTAAASWAIVDRGLTLSNSQVGLVSSIVGALVGAVSTYLGVHVGERGSGPPPTPPPDDDAPPRAP